MNKNPIGTTQLIALGAKLGLGRFAAAAAIYASLAVYLYQPHFKNFNRLQYLIVVSVCFAALGCFVLSRRWVSSFYSSLFAGLIYGFGPFALALAKFHPTICFLAASVPWLFLPAVFGPKGKWQFASVLLSIMPFLMILLFFQISAHYRLFAIPIQIKFRFADLPSLAAPLVMAKRDSAWVGFYHVPIVPLLMGFWMLLAAKRFSIVAFLGIGIILSFCNPIFGISPIIWLTIPVLCCSILIGEGMQGLVSASWPDRVWVLITTGIMTILCLVAVLFATKYSNTFAMLGAGYVKLFLYTAKMYLFGMISAGLILFAVLAKLRVHWLRWSILCTAMAIDIFLGARFIVDMMI